LKERKRGREGGEERKREGGIRLQVEPNFF